MNFKRNIAAIMAASISLGANAEPAPYRPQERDIDPELPRNRLRSPKRGPAPKPSKPLPPDYRANVQSQWGFTAKRSQEIRRAWAAMKPKDRPKWDAYLRSQRNPNNKLEAGQ